MLILLESMVSYDAAHFLLTDAVKYDHRESEFRKRVRKVDTWRLNKIRLVLCIYIKMLDIFSVFKGFHHERIPGMRLLIASRARHVCYEDVRQERKEDAVITTINAFPRYRITPFSWVMSPYFVVYKLKPPCVTKEWYHMLLHLFSQLYYELWMERGSKAL